MSFGTISTRKDYTENCGLYGRIVDGDTGLIEKNADAGKWKWEKIGWVKFTMKGNEMHFSVPRKLLSLETVKGSITLDFKWIDNVPESGDIMDFIDKGDVAPNGRFNYRFRE